MLSVVKSRLQAGQASALKYKSSLDGLLTIIREEGLEGLYKGIGSKLIQSVLTAAILFASQRRIYEITKKVRASAIQTAFANNPIHCRRLRRFLINKGRTVESPAVEIVHYILP